jgi:predicted pyridoxine 5'-phosphate oxidase superfamily flavin-nucleotide-binding protein
MALGGIGSTVPDIAAEFLLQQPMVVVGAADETGRMWATVLAGEPGFLRAVNPITLTVDARPAPDDPLAGVLSGTTAVGMIAIEPANRRRMRINGLAHPTRKGLQVDLHQVIANCPKYIQKRDFTLLPPDERAPRSVTTGTALTAGQQLAVSGADTFFVATASPQGDADASHRGGSTGFVQVLSPTHLRWPDYVGNAMFLTLGNLALNPAAGLVFPDWRTGTLLHVTGSAHTDWDADSAALVPGAQRLVDFHVSEVREVQGAVPLRWTDPVFSRFNPPVSTP